MDPIIKFDTSTISHRVLAVKSEENVILRMFIVNRHGFRLITAYVQNRIRRAYSISSARDICANGLTEDVTFLEISETIVAA